MFFKAMTKVLRLPPPGLPLISGGGVDEGDGGGRYALVETHPCHYTISRSPSQEWNFINEA
jgi:hypothetical protein